jgi:high-affinity Fe2+/Pb2+ permease
LCFYLLPIFVAGNLFKDKIASQFVGAWIFGGIIIVAAAAGFLSKGVTIWEPAIAGAGLFLSFFVVMTIYYRVFVNPDYNKSENILGILIPTVVIFVLSLLGAWFGELVQKLWKTKPPESP